MLDPVKARERKRRYLLRQKVAKFGEEYASVDMRGRHANHARGERNGRWNPGTLVTSHGYVARRVPLDHPHGWGPPGLSYRYAYEHILVVMARIDRPLNADEVVHHRNGDRADNRDENLDLTTRGEHAAEHAAHPGARDIAGRFRADAPRHGDPNEWPESLRVRQFPEASR